MVKELKRAEPGWYKLNDRELVRLPLDSAAQQTIQEREEVLKRAAVLGQTMLFDNPDSDPQDRVADFIRRMRDARARSGPGWEI